MKTNKEVVEDILIFNASIDDIRSFIKGAANQIGSVHFRKRTDDSLRKMSYRLHVTNPTFATKPKGLSNDVITGADTSYTDRNSGLDITKSKSGRKSGRMMSFTPNSNRTSDKKHIDYANNQMTVLDVNKIIRDEDGKIIGRGGWRTIPLEKVKQITHNKKRFIIKSYV